VAGARPGLTRHNGAIFPGMYLRRFNRVSLVVTGSTRARPDSGVAPEPGQTDESSSAGKSR
jgi:hypothetical protein